MQQQLFQQRVLLFRGHLDSESATNLSAQLLTLDAMGTAPVRLRIDSPDGDLVGVLAVVDALDELVAPAYLTVAGELGGASLALLAAADHRTAQPHARLRLSEPRNEANGTANEVFAQASQHLQMVETLTVRLAALTGRPRHEIETDLGTRRYLTATEAREYGLIDTATGQDGDTGSDSS